MYGTRGGPSKPRKAGKRTASARKSSPRRAAPKRTTREVPPTGRKPIRKPIRKASPRRSGEGLVGVNQVREFWDRAVKAATTSQGRSRPPAQRRKKNAYGPDHLRARPRPAKRSPSRSGAEGPKGRRPNTGRRPGVR